jgi:hydrophobic W protein
VRVEPGLHSLTIAASRGAAHEIAGMILPAVFVTTPHSAMGDAVELIGARGGGTWIDAAGGAVILRAPAGGQVLLTHYHPPGGTAMPLAIELRPVDATTAALTAPGGPPLRAEIVLHIEREGDRQFTAGGWAGRLGSRLRVEALAVRPLEAISRGEVEYKVYGTGGRETPWVSDGRLCGTRGQGLPLTGFAIRLAPHLRSGFDVIYRGAFFASGLAPAARNGEACFATLRDDPLEAVEIRIVERGSAR